MVIWLSWIVSNVVLALILALIAWLLQQWRGGKTVARFLWVLALIKLVTPPVVNVPVRQLPAAWACAIGACACEQHAKVGTSMRDALPWFLLATWTIGAGATVWTAWLRWNRFRGLLDHAISAPPEWHALAAGLSDKLSIRRPLEILAVPGRLPPLVVAGWRGPRILLPLEMIDNLQGSQREALLLHELVHIQRRDHLVRFLELAVRVVYWWLPGVGSIGRYLRDCEEAYCDEAVVALLPQARRDYAGLLLDVLDFVAPVPGQSLIQITTMSAARNLEGRLKSILDANQGTRGISPAVSFATGVLAVSLACAILPCGLRCDFGGRVAPASTSAEVVPATGETCAPQSTHELPLSATMCCPS